MSLGSGVSLARPSPTTTAVELVSDEVREAAEIIADAIQQGTGDCEPCQHDPSMRAIHLAGEIILALYKHDWRVIPAAQLGTLSTFSTMRVSRRGGE